MDGLEDFQFQDLQEPESCPDLLVLGGPDMPEKDFQGQDINENIEDLVEEILGGGAQSVTDANIANSTIPDISQSQKSNTDPSHSQDHLGLPKIADGSEISRKAEKEREKIRNIRKMENIRKNIDKLKKRAEQNIGKKYLGFGETKPPSKSKKKKKLKTLKKANVSEEERDLIKSLMEYSESSVNSELSN